jgi:RNA polymerase sigma factor (sigma-70 family)
MLLHWCSRAMGTVDEAEDVLQEALVDAFMSLSAFRGESRITTWICGIAKYKVRRFLQEKGRRESMISLVSDRETDLDEIPDESDTAEGLMMSRQRRHWALVEMVESLPEKYAEQIRLTLQGLKRREVAALLNLPLGTIKSRHSRAVTMLRRKIRNGNGNPIA